jgi:hypothetical protein
LSYIPLSHEPWRQGRPWRRPAHVAQIVSKQLAPEDWGAASPRRVCHARRSRLARARTVEAWKEQPVGPQMDLSCGRVPGCDEHGLVRYTCRASPRESCGRCTPRSGRADRVTSANMSVMARGAVPCELRRHRAPSGRAAALRAPAPDAGRLRNVPAPIRSRTLAVAETLSPQVRGNLAFAGGRRALAG